MSTPTPRRHRVMRWLRWGYDGPRPRERLVILHLLDPTPTDREVRSVARQAVQRAEAAGLDVVTEYDVRAMVFERTAGPVTDEAVVRVASELARRGWRLRPTVPVTEVDDMVIETDVEPPGTSGEPWRRSLHG
ncbi:MAG: DUF3349 domain-containing protein [Kineosporiaceae bacterium]|nr:DUF3349 domain-containing protein [Kineosporiaceae bacterium]